MNLDISKKESSILKGVAILFIMLHNFFHWVSPIIGENEFSFNVLYFHNYINYSFLKPVKSLQFFFSYFGHYGVQVFIFCSGYGLVKIYKGRYWNFMKKRLIKLYPTFLIGLLFLFGYRFIAQGTAAFDLVSKDLFLRLTMLANFIPKKVFVISGPYWFYSMIIQLYVCFPLFFKIHQKSRYGLCYVVFIAYFLLFLFGDFFVTKDVSLYYNFIGNVPVFVFGIMFSDISKYKVPKYIEVFALMLFVLGQFNTYLWYFSQLSFIVFIIPFSLFLIRKFNKSIFLKWMKYTGEISMYIFVVNGFLRGPWIGFSERSSYSFGVYFYSIIFLISTYAVAITLKATMSFLTTKINSKKT